PRLRPPWLPIQTLSFSGRFGSASLDRLRLQLSKPNARFGRCGARRVRRKLRPYLDRVGRLAARRERASRVGEVRVAVAPAFGYARGFLVRGGSVVELVLLLVPGAQ